jgi:chromatin remodeling complex protein RSC6
MPKTKAKAAKKKSPSKSEERPKSKPRSAGGKGAQRGGIAQEVQPDDALAAIVGKRPLTRADLTKKLWAYIREKDLQDAEDRRMIHADDALRPIFGKAQVSMFEMTKLVNQHVR